MDKELLVYLVTAAQQGDNDALNSLFNAFYNDLYYFALKTLKDEQLALDITQDAFIEIFNTLDHLQEPAAFVTWAKQITYHQCTRYFKKKKDVIVDEDEDGHTVFDTLQEENAEFIPDEALDLYDFKNTILAILDELSEEQRSATMMYYFDEMSVRQIAEIQSVSEGTVKSRLNYARKAIKASVEEYERKNNVKLHAVPFFPLFRWLFHGSFEGGLHPVTAQLVAENVSYVTGTTITATASSAAAATVTTAATTATAVGIGAKIAALPIATKVIAGVVAAAIAVGGGTTAVVLTKDKPAAEPVLEQTDTHVDAGELVLEGIIPAGCTYTLTDGTVLTEGNEFPDQCTAGDMVEYGDYLYGYECIYAKNSDGIDEWYLWKDGFDGGDSGLIESDAFDSWSVVVADQTKKTYGQIVSNINGKPIKTLYATFVDCVNMTSAPEIPSTITAMSATFYGCTSLKKAPVIPNNVQRMMLTFGSCTSLTGDVEINATLDKSLEWFYSQVFAETKGEINLVGSTPVEDLILIATSSNNPNITVNGTKIFDLDVLKGDAEVLNVAADYAARLQFSDLPYFTDASELSASNVFWFIYYGIKDYGGDEDGNASNTFSVDLIDAQAESIFGHKYNFREIKDHPYLSDYTAGYMDIVHVYGEDIDKVYVVCPDETLEEFDNIEITECIKLTDTRYQVNTVWQYSVLENPAHNHRVTGEIKEAMILERNDYEDENGYYSDWKLISYSKIEENFQ